MIVHLKVKKLSMTSLLWKWPYLQNYEKKIGNTILHLPSQLLKEKLLGS